MVLKSVIKNTNILCATFRRVVSLFCLSCFSRSSFCFKRHIFRYFSRLFLVLLMNAFISSSLYLWLLSDLEYTLIYDKIIINLIFLKKRQNLSLHFLSAWFFFGFGPFRCSVIIILSLCAVLSLSCTFTRFWEIPLPCNCTRK